MKNVLIATALLGFTGFASAASFDCAKAGTNVEKMICSNDFTSKLDSELSQIYNSLPSKPVEDQRAWIKFTRNAQTTIEGLNYVYASRIEELVNVNSFTETPMVQVVEVQKPQVQPKQVKSFNKTSVELFESFTNADSVKFNGRVVRLNTLDDGNTRIAVCAHKLGGRLMSAYESYLNKQGRYDLFERNELKIQAFVHNYHYAEMTSGSDIGQKLISLCEMS